jgi:glycine/D-amino acid oxidase-like deaminating enzyme
MGCAAKGRVLPLPAFRESPRPGRDDLAPLREEPAARGPSRARALPAREVRTPRVLVTQLWPLPKNVRQVSEDILITVEEGVEHATQAAAERSLEGVRRMLAGPQTLKLDGMGIGSRAMPADGLPIVGFAPDIDGLYLTAMHSGVSLAPTIGHLAAVEIIE